MIRSLTRRAGAACGGAVAATALALSPAAMAAESDATSATAVFDGMSCTGGKHTVDLSVTNPSPSRATFTVRVDGPNVATPNTVAVPASGSNAVKVTLPDDATKATVEDSTGAVVGASNLTCSSASASASPSTSAAASSAAAVSPAASADSADSASTSAQDNSPSVDNTRTFLGFGVAGIGVLLAAALLYREFH